MLAAGLATLAWTLVIVMPPASAAGYTGGLAPTIYGGLADVNGSGTANTVDNSNAFFGDTSIIDGGLDCNAWGATPNDGTAGQRHHRRRRRLHADRRRRHPDGALRSPSRTVSSR